MRHDPGPPLPLEGWTLRPLRSDDAAAWLAIVQEPQLRELTSWSVERLEDMVAIIEAQTVGPRAATTRRWAIVDDDGRFCGTCGFKDWDRDDATAEIVYELAAKQRGRGVMSAVAAAVVEHGWRVMGLRRITAIVMTDNAASTRLLHTLGFRQVDALPAFRSCGGRPRDFARFALRHVPER
jgi:ribosomal-protein-alanine N-acetyltransferase